MDVRELIFQYFNDTNNANLFSLMGYLDTDTLVAWFVDEGYVDDIDDENDHEMVMDYYTKHC